MIKFNKIKYIPISIDEIKKKKIISRNLSLFKSFLLIIIIMLFFLLFFIINYKNKSYKLKNSRLNINKEEFLKLLKKILKDGEILENEMMKKHTTFKIGGPAKYFIKPKSINQIIEIILLCNKYNVRYFILGNGSNLLVSDNGYNGVIIQIHEYNFSNLTVKKSDENNYILTVGGGMLMKTLSIESCFLSLTGLEDIIDIPGTVGGGIIMNASFKGTGLIEPLIKVKVITPKGELLELSKEDCKLVRRGSMLKDKKYLVIEAMFLLKKGDKMIIQKKMTDNTKMRYEKQPMYFGSAGTFFVWNRSQHGSQYKLYKEQSIVGYRVGNAMIYTFNISFIVNLGNSTASEVMEIVTYIEKIMKEKYNIELKREVIVIGIF